MKGNEAEQINIETRQTSWEELGISNDFLFGKVMQNPELCKELLQRILPDLKIDHIEYPELQKNIKQDIDAKSVRLDVYVKDEKTVVYDIEMQVSDTKELPKRSRYYQSMIDLQLIDKGQYYNELNRSYVIFICPFDAFGKGRHIYTFENICKEDGNISMGDEAVKIFLNAKGTMDDVSKELKAFLDYVAGKKPVDSYVEKLEEAVKEAKKNREWRHEYMTLLMRDQENQKIGEKRGEKNGEKKMAKLIMLLNEDGRLSDIIKVSQDEEYRQKLYVEYHIS
ncbi:MAG: Rpn family recombination-promoting nuclease/putative transposase [Lachnospiraceae bacterium]|nr:Rpn family recombination-promoting nuclease/putative transposase [Lachnospiraceae bacterium]